MALLAFALCAALSGVLFSARPASARSGSRTSASARSGSRTSTRSVGAGALTLLEPPSFVTPSEPFSVQLGLPSSPARSSMSLEVSLYPCLGSRSAFDQTVNAAPAGQPVVTTSIPVSSLASVAGGVELTASVQAGAAPPVGSGPFGAVLQCGSSSYYGVYPVYIELFEGSSSAPAGSLTTYLVYTPASNAQPLRFALVVPFSALLASSPTPGTLPTPSGAEMQRLASLASALSGAHQQVALTVVPDPSVIAPTYSLATGAARSKEAQSLLQLLSAVTSSPVHQVLCGPFTSVDTSALVSVGLSGELASQVDEGAAVLSKDLGVTCPTGGTWLSQVTLDQPALDALGSLGYSGVLVPETGLAPPGPSLSEQRLFYLGGSRSGSLLAAMIDPVLSSRLSSGSSDPALVADQIVSELEEIYFDAPNTVDPRGVVAVAPSEWDDPALVSDLLAALADNPMVKPVTLQELFSSPPVGLPVGGTVGSSEQPYQRRPSTTSTNSALPARSIRAVRAELESFESAVSQSTAGDLEVQRLDQLLLSSESQELSSRKQRSMVSAASAALQSQLHSLSINTGGIRLASNAALVPITVVKQLPYSVTAVLQVTSDKLVFPQSSQSPGSFCTAPKVQSSAGRSTFASQCTIGHGTNVIYVDMRTRAAGDFRVSVTLSSPTGGLVLASAQLSVRSMSISAVSIALSIAAAVVLLAWWGRTAWRRRAGRTPARPAHARGSRAAAR